MLIVACSVTGQSGPPNPRVKTAVGLGSFAQDTARAVAFLEYLKSTAGEFRGTFDPQAAGNWVVDSVMAYVSAEAVRLTDVNTAADSVYTRGALRQALMARTGPAFVTFTHLSVTYAGPPQYSALRFTAGQGNVIVDVSDFYRLTFKHEGGRLQLVRVDYVQFEGH